MASRLAEMQRSGYFDDRSMLRRVHRERAVALSGPRALLPGRVRLVPSARAA